MRSLDYLSAPSFGEFAQLLRTLREKACLTQEELAERSGLSIRAISDLERGRTSKPQRKSVVLLAEALRIEGDSLEKFRRIARRKVDSGSSASVRPLALSTACPMGPAAGDDLPAGLSSLIEWMRHVLVEQPVWLREPGGVDVPGQRMVELVGGPGTEKTLVAIQAAARFPRHFPDGQFYVSAEGHDRRPVGLVDRLLRVFGAESAGCETLEERAERLRSTLRSRRALLVLDNVVDAAQVRPLLTAGSVCAVIVIAQRRLAVSEGVWTIDVSTVERECPVPYAVPPALLTG
ncbi:helix-turn-helix domain-containing protein [Actinokineospora xionganensis]|uniref:Helix-turn-helix transcriptional regulator n=1 Tax=Actinokineospora xionganensis TaxID=2684470 RepID=A0ABR7LFJ0_9PSEU|nr:helix-turn-helix domain-containing protein [Actinokineospora xionganensis]MBC6451486.1 helix-turn-helix transcriptional regulator [Actinokineospora xionganensis]